MKARLENIQLSTLVLLPFLVCSSTVKAADQTQLVEDAGAWFQAVAEGSLKSVDPSLDKARVWLEGQSRFDQGMDHWYQGMIRAAAGYSLSDRATIWAGYTYLLKTSNMEKVSTEQQLGSKMYGLHFDISCLPILAHLPLELCGSQILD